MSEYLLYRIGLKNGESIYTIHAPRYRCHVGELIEKVQASDIDDAIRQFSLNFFDYPEFKRCGCLEPKEKI